MTLSNWTPLNDTVMGGESSSRWRETEDGGVFEGTVSLANGGGFASVRSPEALRDWSDADGVRMTVVGDGKTYKLTMYTRPGGRISYRASFAAPDGEAEVVVPFEELTPYRRGRHVPSAPAFDPSAITQVGLLISDKQAGDFQLRVRDLQAWQRE